MLCFPIANSWGDSTRFGFPAKACKVFKLRGDEKCENAFSLTWKETVLRTTDSDHNIHWFMSANMCAPTNKKTKRSRSRFTSLLGRVLQRQRRVSSARSDYMLRWLFSVHSVDSTVVFTVFALRRSLLINYAILPPVLAVDPAILCP